MPVLLAQRTFARGAGTEFGYALVLQWTHRLIYVTQLGSEHLSADLAYTSVTMLDWPGTSDIFDWQIIKGRVPSFFTLNSEGIGRTMQVVVI